MIAALYWLFRRQYHICWHERRLAKRDLRRQCRI